MNINKNNYEVFFIDYYDGILSAEQTAALFLFLEAHPELRAEFDDFSNVQLEIPAVQFPGRDALKRGEDTISNIDQRLVASLEGDNSFEEKLELESYLQSNPQFQKDAKLYEATVSVPDLSIVYPDKKSLKKAVPFFTHYRNEIRYGIAAVLLLGFIAGMISVFNRTMEQKSVQVADETPAVYPSGISQPGISDSSDISVPDSQKDNLSTERIGSAAVPLTAEIKKQPEQHKNKSDQAEKMQAVQQVPVQLAQVLPGNPLAINSDSSKVVLQPGLASASDQSVPGNSGEKYMTVWEALRQTSDKNIKKILTKDEPVLAYADETDDSKTRLVDVVSKSLESISNDKVKLESDKESKKFSFSVGNFKIERK